MKPCIYRLYSDSKLTTCNNTIDLVHRGTVPTEFCNSCMYANDGSSLRPKPSPAVVRPCSGCPDPYIVDIPAKKGSYVSTGTIRRGEYVSRATVVNPILEPTDSDWATVVTTTPRTSPTVGRCIQSIKDAGWNPIVFAEPDSIHVPNTKYITNPVRLGAWFNWLQSVKWALSNTQAKYILSVQDDSLFHPDSRTFVEKVMWPSHSTGFISLYTASHYSADRSGNLKPFGINKLRTSSLWGACALVFSRDSISKIIEHPIVEDWIGVPPLSMDANEKKKLTEQRKLNPQLIQNVDTAIGKIINSLHLDMYVIDPSPVHHIASHSAIHHGGNTGKRNCGRCSDHLAPLAPQVFPTRGSIKRQPGVGLKIQEVLEAEIGNPISCATCLEFLKSIDTIELNDVQDLVLKLYSHVPLPNEWRKKYVGRTYRLQRIEELIKPFLTTAST